MRSYENTKRIKTLEGPTGEALPRPPRKIPPALSPSVFELWPFRPRNWGPLTYYWTAGPPESCYATDGVVFLRWITSIEMGVLWRCRKSTRRQRCKVRSALDASREHQSESFAISHQRCFKSSISKIHRHICQSTADSRVQNIIVKCQLCFDLCQQLIIR